MWLDAHSAMEISGRTDVAGEYKAILELAEPLMEELGRENVIFHMLTESQIQNQVKNRLKGGQIAYKPPLRYNGLDFGKGIAEWLRKEKWWFSLVLVLYIFFAYEAVGFWLWSLLVSGRLQGLNLHSFAGVNRFAFPGSVFLSYGTTLALMIGKTNKTRIALALPLWAVGISFLVLWFNLLLNGRRF